MHSIFASSSSLLSRGTNLPCLKSACLDFRLVHCNHAMQIHIICIFMCFRFEATPPLLVLGRRIRDSPSDSLPGFLSFQLLGEPNFGGSFGGCLCFRVRFWGSPPKQHLQVSMSVSGARPLDGPVSGIWLGPSVWKLGLRFHGRNPMVRTEVRPYGCGSK